MGLKVLDEHPHRITPDGMPPMAMHDFGCSRRCPMPTWRSTRCTRCSRTRSAASSAARSRATTSTGWSIAARIPATEIVVLRAYAKYMRQIGFPLSQAFIEATLAAHAAHRALADRAVPRALRPATAGSMPVRAPRSTSARSRRRSRTSRTCPRTACCASTWRSCARRRAPISGAAMRRAGGAASCRSSSTRRRCPDCPSRSRCSRSSCTRCASRACTCAAGASRAAVCAGRTARRISERRCWGS